jgi:hypothetical protein
MSSSKTINISPKLFKLKDSKPSRKRVKHQANKLNKHKLINRLKQHMSTQKNLVPAEQNLSNFDKHLSYFQKLNKEKKKTRSRNKSENVFTALPTDMKSGVVTACLKEDASHYRIKPAPNYGILKGTNKPTMREWKRSTQKNMHHVLASESSPPAPLLSESPRAHSLANIPPIVKHAIPLPLPQPPSLPPPVHVPISTISNNLSTPLIVPPASAPIYSISSVTPTAKPCAIIPPNRKTYYLGKRENKIGVLIKNNSTRKRIKDEINILNAAPIYEVKEYLKKHQLYKAGNNTPQDVLREIYKSAHLAGKPVKNKSAENLLHNFYKL